MKPKLDIGLLEVTRKDLKKAVATYASALIDYRYFKPRQTWTSCQDHHD